MAYGLPNTTASHIKALKRSLTILSNKMLTESLNDRQLSRIQAIQRELSIIRHWTERFPSPRKFIVYYDTCDRKGVATGDYSKEWVDAHSRYEAAVELTSRNWDVLSITDVVLDKYTNR